jgi:hypothetical protein
VPMRQHWVNGSGQKASARDTRSPAPILSACLAPTGLLVLTESGCDQAAYGLGPGAALLLGERVDAWQ